ncbi:hypothetical protein ASG69_20960 [Rhodococcus sp. Leaf225]|nr:hypothetical protein ASG69_20960 [Rhodococcus sp. Leaf225]KQU41193.1 hypothetical protein ASH03_17820 [Rhodococcus sp. Leaf258]
MPDALLVLNVDFEISDKDYSTLGSDAFPATTELPRLHVTLHYVDAILLIERDARYLVETHYVVLSNKTALATCVIDEHSCDSCLASRN